MSESVAWSFYDTPDKRRLEALRRIDHQLGEMASKLQDAEGQLIAATWTKTYSDQLNDVDPSGDGLLEIQLDPEALRSRVAALSAARLHWQKVRGLIEQTDF